MIAIIILIYLFGRYARISSGLHKLNKEYGKGLSKLVLTITIMSIMPTTSTTTHHVLILLCLGAKGGETRGRRQKPWFCSCGSS